MKRMGAWGRWLHQASSNLIGPRGFKQSQKVFYLPSCQYEWNAATEYPFRCRNRVGGLIIA